MGNTKLFCIYCDRTVDEVPIVMFQFGSDTHGICPQHLPLLIHKPAELADKLPGIEAVQPLEGHEHS